MLPVAHWTTRYRVNVVLPQTAGSASVLRSRNSSRPAAPTSPAAPGRLFAAHLAADAGLLVAAERRVRCVPEAAVDAHRAGADAPRDRQRAVVIGTDDRAGQAVDGVVGDADRVVVTVVRQDDEDRPEQLVLRDRRVLVNTSEQRRFVVVTRRQVLGR